MIAACLKWVDHRPQVDPLTGAVRTDARTSGPSGADQAALEWALRLGEAWAAEVIVATAGPAGTEPMLRDALASGAARAVRTEILPGTASEQVAAALAAVLPTEVDVVVCGAWSTDRGSGAVPAYLAAHRRAAQALSVISIGIDSAPGALTAERRLDGGRRERLRVTTPAVVSFEGGARLRRSSLPGVLVARDAAIEVVEPPPAIMATATRLVRTGPFRPRSRVLPPPPSSTARERILALTGALVDRRPPRMVRLTPAAAADELLSQLEAWGYR